MKNSIRISEKSRENCRIFFQDKKMIMLRNEGVSIFWNYRITYEVSNLSNHRNAEKVFCIFVFFGAPPMAYGGSQAGGQIAASLHTATATPDPSLVCDLHHSSWKHRILSSLSKARD